MEQKFHIPCSQGPANVLYPELDASSPDLPTLFPWDPFYSNTIFTSMPRCFFPSGSPTKILYAFFISLMQATCSTPLILLPYITLIIFGEVYKLRSSSVCSLLQLPATYTLLGPIILSTLFLNTLNPCSSLNVRNQVSHP